ncbi:hypothetical protein B0A55_10767 [Friedmanniomyces simplex]|uniref:Uncharacterized protein n=1 Tax=Friedmanniomyces simplex TaxID=329884 RepID=A0A4U0X5J6_9PEZI|nr:hypothetical protein B0A55_10767 [Friedmanniomyces simplex]
MATRRSARWRSNGSRSRREDRSANGIDPLVQSFINRIPAQPSALAPVEQTS